jgi:hypothetical protein
LGAALREENATNNSLEPNRPGAATERGALQLDIIVPVVMSCALLWWVSRGMGWTTRLVVAAVTLALIVCIVLFERSGLK